MRKLLFYFRMAGQSLQKNSLLYIPYWLTGAVCTALCYIMRYLSYNELIAAMPGAAWVALMLTLGSAIMVFLICWIMVYANGFVMKRRKRELGLYHILGMEKGQIAWLMLLETLLLAAASIAGGIALGALFSKLVLMLLFKLLQFDIPMGFSFCAPGAVETAVALLVLYLLLYLVNLRRVGKASAIDLLHSTNVGEQEPKTRRLRALLGIAFLGAGYAISLLTTSPAAVILMFFVAVAFVIEGTHMLFSAGSVVVLKALRRNKAFYYQPRHFTAVSGLLYRMNQNAKGLANICILSTTVLVSLATTVSLYAGTEDSLRMNYPDEIAVYANCDPETFAQADLTALDDAVRAIAVANGCPADAVRGYTSLGVTAIREGASFEVGSFASVDLPNTYLFEVLTAEDYTRLTGEAVQLSPGEVLLYGSEPLDSFTLAGMDFTVAGQLASFPLQDATARQNMIRCYGAVVADRTVLRSLYERQAAAREGRFYAKIQHTVAVNPARWGADALVALADALESGLGSFSAAPAFLEGFEVQCRQEYRTEYYSLYGGFLFLGAFLAIMFMLATVLIIYYKQISEGYEDRERFVILQKVGMDEREVRGTIHSQVLMVFFLPLAFAALHVLAASPMLLRLIGLFGMFNLNLYILCTVVTVAVFGCCYVGVYLVTARKYFAIVRR